MFSIMTIASSTTKPVAIVIAINDRLLRLNPARYMTASVPTNDSGTDRLGISVADGLRRNRKMTGTTRTTGRPRGVSWGGFWSGSLGLVVFGRGGPAKLPLGVLRLALARVERKSSMLRPEGASWRKLAWMRTAGR